MIVGLLGGGVIGAGWAARWVLNGHDVQIFDPDPEAPRKVNEVLTQARRAYAKLLTRDLPPEGALTFAPSVATAVEGAVFVQESAPERLDVKQMLLGRADEVADPSVILASSTSGLLPSAMQAGLRHPERLVVGHPFNPVYLLPLVEVCPGPATTMQVVNDTAAIYSSLGMHPLTLRKEIDGFVADRLLEALWREALWLVNDGVATTSEIDDAIRFGAGLRWSFMGTFLVYRIAGGESGMRHFMAQFGPALQWPWTKLTDVPELTDDLLDTIVSQSDEQASGRSIRELEALRDDCIVAVLQGLRAARPGGYAAGATLDQFDHHAPVDVIVDDDADRALRSPLSTMQRRVTADWLDYNGHVNDSRYMQLSSEATDEFLRSIGSGDAGEGGGSYFTAESHLAYYLQAFEGDELTVEVRVLDHDPKRLRIWTDITRNDELVATAEHMLLHVDRATGRVSSAPRPVLDMLGVVSAAHESLPMPHGAGRSIGQPRTKR
jgi:carnitine 3-dehydrogenase